MTDSAEKKVLEELQKIAAGPLEPRFWAPVMNAIREKKEQRVKESKKRPARRANKTVTVQKMPKTTKIDKNGKKDGNRFGYLAPTEEEKELRTYGYLELLATIAGVVEDKGIELGDPISDDVVHSVQKPIKKAQKLHKKDCDDEPMDLSMPKCHVIK